MRVLVPLLLATWFVPVAKVLGQRREADTATSTTEARSSGKFWGVNTELGSATLDVDKLNTYFAPYTGASISREGISQTLQVMISDKRFGYGSAYYQQAITFPEEDRLRPSLSLHQHTVGFELHKVLVDKRIKVVLPSAGIGYRFANVTYSPEQPASLPLDSLFQHSGAFTLRNQSMTASAGAGVYYVVRGFKAASIRQLDLGLAGSYIYTLRPGDWSLFGTGTTVLVPPTRINYYTVRFSATLLLNW
jgi:hypothetical protein